MRTRDLFVVLTIALVFVAGCGGGTGSTASDPTSSPSSASSPPVSPSSALTTPPTPTGPVLPNCADVWVDGATLPGRYAGCEADGVRVKTTRRFCEFGRPLITYADSFYAVTNGVIHGTNGPLKQDPGFQRAMSSCMA